MTLATGVIVNLVTTPVTTRSLLDSLFACVSLFLGNDHRPCIYPPHSIVVTTAPWLATLSSAGASQFPASNVRYDESRFPP